MTAPYTAAELAAISARAEREISYAYGNHDLANYVVRLVAELTRAREALERLGSMEAFDVARCVKPGADDELIARIDYARAALGEEPAPS